MSSGGADEPSRADGPGERQLPEPREASAPWERPRRWAHDRSDATRVEDLLARLSGTGLPAESRRHRRSGDEADEAVPAGELIAALGANTGGTSVDEQPAAALAEPDTESPVQPEAGPPTAGAESVHVDADGPAEAAEAEPAHPDAEPPETAAAPSADAADDAPTVLLPVIGGPPQSADSPGVAADPDASWKSVLASLQRQTATGEPAAAATTAPSTPRRRPAGGPDPRQHHRLLIAGRSAIALFAVLLLLITGTEWVIKARADAALRNRQVSAIVSNDPNISTPTVDLTSGEPQAGANPQQPHPDGSAKVYQAENILLMGSDSRASAEDHALGGSGTVTMQSDVLMIAHISADRSHVTVVSIPRDTWVDAPICKAWDYATNSLSDQDYPNQYSEWKITNAYSVGGAQCTVRAVQKLTGLRINRVIIIDFAGFKSMVDALGGITVNACRPIIDTNPGIGTVLPRAGEQHINGTQALKLVRARHVIGDSESDMARIRRQQKVLSTLLGQASSAGVLLNPAKLNSLLQAFVHNTHTDNVTLDDLLNIAQSLGNLDPKRVTFYTLPTVPDGDGERMTKAGSLIWNALVNDQPLPGEVTAPPEPLTSSSPPAGSTTPSTSSPRASRAPSTRVVTRVVTSLVTSTPVVSQSISVSPGDVDLQVVNVAGRGGVATQAMNALNPLGFAISDPDLLLIEGDVRDGITVEFSAGNRAAALTVASAVPGATLVRTPGLGQQVRLMLGSSFDGTVRSVAVGDPLPAALSTTPTPVVSTVLSTRTRTVTPNGGAAPVQNPATSAAPTTTAPTTTAVTTSTPPAGPTLSSGQVESVNAGSSGCI